MTVLLDVPVPPRSSICVVLSVSAEKKDCGVGVLQVSSAGCDSTKPWLHVTASSQEEQGVEGNCTQLPGGSPVAHVV